MSNRLSPEPYTLIIFADSACASHWPPVLLPADFYSQALPMIGDDEFFSSSSSPSSSPAVRNPLTIDELVSFSKQLFNIVFTTYWRDDQSIMHGVYIYVLLQVRCSWEMVREKVTKCLLGIHARE